MKRKFQQLVRWCNTQIKSISPGTTALKGAALSLLLVTGLLWGIFAIGVTANIRDGWVLLLFIGFVLAAILAAYLTRWLLRR